jgi:LysR family transcriptional regulator for metE and metH
VKLNDLDLNKLQVFLAVAERRGITAAAVELGRTRSAVSQSVSALEGSLGVKLFDRVGKRLVPTRPGRLLHERLRDVQGGLQRAVDEIVDEAGEVRGLVRIGLFLGFPRVRFASFLSRFAARHPRASVRLVFAPQDDLTARLLANRLDYSFSFQPLGGGARELAATRLFEQKLVLVTGKTFFRRGFRADELPETPVVDYYQSDPLIERWLAHHLGGERPALDVKVWAATTDMVLELVLDGVGVGVVPDSLAAPYVARRRLRVLGTRKGELTDFIWLNEPRGAYRDATLAAFRAAALEEFR